MNLAANPAVIALLGQIFISLYPIIIKRSDATIPQQLAGRFSVYSLLPILLGGIPVLRDTFGTSALAGKTLAAGAVNILHVTESYKSFQLLPAGIAYTILYTYPFWNLIGARLLFGETIPVAAIPLFFLAFIGTLLIIGGSQQMMVKSSAAAEPEKKTRPQTIRGLIAAVTGAITETLLYLIVRGSEFDSPLKNIARLYMGAAAILGLSAAVTPGRLAEVAATPPEVPLFNGLIGFTSMSALVWAAKKLPAYIYSMIAFVGLVASYIWGMVFAEEVPSLIAIAGSAIIALSVWLLPTTPAA
jgi:drug/metabolite transporter (DMT)-like permease